MRIALFLLSSGVCLAAVFGLPNEKAYKESEGYYHELARELVEEVLEEELQNANNPAYANIEENRGYSPPYKASDQVRGNSAPYKNGDEERGNSPPYINGEEEKGNSPPYVSGEEERGNSPSYTNGEEERGNSPPYVSGEEERGNSPSYINGEEERGNSPSYINGEEERGNSPPYKGSEQVRENNPPYISDEEERGNNPPYISGEEENGSDLPNKGGEQERGYSPPYIGGEIENNVPSTASHQERDSVSSYKETGERYLQLAREVADQYMEERKKTKEESRSSQDVWTAEGALRAFNRQGSRTQRLSEELERENAELETLLRLTAGEDPKMLRHLQNIDLTARRARPDPMCKIRIDCNLASSRNFIGTHEFRTINGSCNNLNNYTWGMAGTQHRRLLPDAYENGQWRPRTFSVIRPPRTPLPSPRDVSNVMHKTSSPKLTTNSSATLAFFYFAQFVDHDVAKTPEGEIPPRRNCCRQNTGYCMALTVDVPDDHFAPNYCMPSRRSFTLFRCNDTSQFQNQINELSAYIDGSMVYGSTDDEEATLRAHNSGYLEESTKEFMPNSTRPAAFGCRVTPPEVCYEAGDTRANVHPGLTTFHTVFVRQHNRIAKQFSEIRPDWSDERVYQETRKIVGAQIQHLVYNEFLPVLIRGQELDKYKVTSAYSYDPSIDASMTQAFSIAFRYHNLMPDALHLGKIVDESALLFEEFNQENVFLKPSFVNRNHFSGINEVALGLALSSCPHANRLMNDATRNLLFLDNFNNSFDLAALNIARGREWGMPPYTEYRAWCGLGNATKWEDLLNTTSQEAVDKLKSVYTSVLDIDPWVGFYSEEVLPGSVSGPTQSCLVAKHFANLKHGDRFFYTGAFTNEQLAQIKEKTTLARILCDNLNVSRMKKNVFDPNSDWLPCNRIFRQTGQDLNLESWV